MPDIVPGATGDVGPFRDRRANRKVAQRAVTSTFVHDFTHVALGFDDVRARLLEAGGKWIAPLADAAYVEGEELRIRIGPGDGSVHLVTKEVALELGEPYERQDLFVVPLRWSATGTPGLFPSMDADLECAPFGANVTQITMRGRYEPPLGTVGRGIDRLLLHRVAEASVRSFLRHVALALEHPIAPVG